MPRKVKETPAERKARYKIEANRVSQERTERVKQGKCAARVECPSKPKPGCKQCSYHLDRSNQAKQRHLARKAIAQQELASECLKASVLASRDATLFLGQ